MVQGYLWTETLGRVSVRLQSRSSLCYKDLSLYPRLVPKLNSYYNKHYMQGKLPN
jgi:hypothetical protein